jgi:hypothetical protein
MKLSFATFIAVMFQFKVNWVVTLCSVEVGYRHNLEDLNLKLLSVF